MAAADVLILGGGPAGLSAALGLARHLHRVIIFDNNSFRNDATSYMHNVLSWDHKAPAEFRDAARANLEARYNTIQFQAKNIVKVRKVEGGFEADDSEGKTYTGKKLVLAQGRKDIYPDIKGYDKCWGHSVFHCLFCHGYEERGGDFAGLLAVGTLSNPDMLLHTARMASQLAKNLTIYTHGDPALAERLQTLWKDKPLKIESRKIAQLEHLGDDGVKVHFDDAETKIERFIVNMPNTVIRGDFHSQLGLEMEDQMGHPCVKVVSPFKETSVPGCFAVGDIHTLMASVVNAMQSGGVCAAAISPQLVQLKSF